MTGIVREVMIGPHRLIQGDCLEVMPGLGRFDAVVTDPPYGVNYSGSTTKCTARDGVGYSQFKDTPDNVSRICVPAVRLAVSYASCGVVTPGNACAFLYDTPRSMGTIYYPSGANCGPWGFVCSQPLFYYGKDPYLSRMMGSRPNGFSSTETVDKSINHPCPKPINVMKWLVLRVSIAPATILDPFMGSGTTGVACVREGRVFTGIELDPEYFDIACERIRKEMAQPRLDLPVPIQPKQEALQL